MPNLARSPILLAVPLLAGIALLGRPARADSTVFTDQASGGAAGGGAISLITQSGANNYANVDQSGGYLNLTQAGNGNRALISIVGSSVTASQVGSGLSVTITGNGPSVVVTQSKPGG